MIDNILFSRATDIAIIITLSNFSLVKRISSKKVIRRSI